MNNSAVNPTFIPEKTDGMLCWQWSNTIDDELSQESMKYDVKNTKLTSEDQFRGMIESLGLGYCNDGNCVYASGLNSETKGLIAVRCELRNQFELLHVSVKSNSSRDVEYIYSQILQKIE
ncbi:hypothetical protein ABPG74_011380 [Tetrahymena malaccensis]